MRSALILGVASLILAGCQTTDDDSVYSKGASCRNSGLAVGTIAYHDCLNAVYDTGGRTPVPPVTARSGNAKPDRYSNPAADVSTRYQRYQQDPYQVPRCNQGACR